MPTRPCVSALGQDVTDIFREQRKTVEPVYTGKRGGEFLVEVTMLLTTAWANKEIILSDFSALAGILTPLVLASRSLWQAYERRIGKPLAQQKPLAITIEVHGITMKVEANDQKDAVALATELAQRLQMLQAAEDKQQRLRPHLQRYGPVCQNDPPAKGAKFCHRCTKEGGKDGWRELHIGEKWGNGWHWWSEFTTCSCRRTSPRLESACRATKAVAQVLETAMSFYSAEA